MDFSYYKAQHEWLREMGLDVGDKVTVIGKRESHLTWTSVMTKFIGGDYRITNIYKDVIELEILTLKFKVGSKTSLDVKV
jgi:hypothetical protein